MEEAFLAFVLDDYSKPPFVSGCKTYYGTLDAFEGLLTECRNEQLIEPYERLRRGEKNIKIDVAYNKEPFGEKVKYVDWASFTYTKGRYEHENAHGFPYLIYYDHISERRLLLKHGREYVVVYRLEVEGLEYENELSTSGRSAINSFWGFPNMIKNRSDTAEKTILVNTLYVTRFKSQDREEAIKELHARCPNFKQFLNDVFGDG